MDIFKFLLICFSVLTISQAYDNTVPNFLEICHRNDPNITFCIKDSIEKLRPRLNDGIPELFVPKCEPLHVPEIIIEENTGPISLKSTYKNIKIYGLTKFNIKTIRIDTVKDKFRLKIWFPSLYMKADYSINGKLMMLPIHGEGTCSGNFTEVEVIAYIKGERYLKNTFEFMRIRDIFVKFNIGGSKVHLNNLFNGNLELGATMNRFLNDNWKPVVAELRPGIENSLADMLKEISSNLFNVFAYDQLLPA